MELAWVVDAVVIVLIIISAYLAMVRGLARELFALASWVIAFVAAFYFAPSVKPLLPNLPGVGQFISQCEIVLLAAFVVVFGLALLISGVLIWILSGPTTNATVGAVDQGLGFVYGALRGLVLVAVVYIAFESFVDSGGVEYEFVKNAYTHGLLERAAGIIDSIKPEKMPEWFAERVRTMMAACSS